MPNDNCPLCAAIGVHLAHTLASLEPPFIAATDEPPPEVRAHALAAICSWWVSQTLLDPTWGPEAVVRCVANCLLYEHGVQGAERLTAVQVSRTT